MYILTRQEGNVYNCKVLDLAKRKGYKALLGRYYLADVRYLNIPIMLTPYQGIRYYFYKQSQANIRPQNIKELFNLHYLSLRNIIKYTFRVYKKYFQYFKSVKINFRLLIQVLLIYTLTVVYNFLNIYNPDNLDNYNKEDMQIVEVKSNIGMN